MSTKFEQLPNEILTDIFDYFESDELFQLFFNLNLRFNQLLQSLTNLCFIPLLPQPEEYEFYQILTPSISNLQLISECKINLSDFPNLRRMKFLNPSSFQLEQILTKQFPYLEYLTIEDIDYLFLYEVINDLYPRVFNNDFPRLQSCKLPSSDFNFNESILTHLTHLHTLQIGIINFTDYQLILSICPNLYFFQFTIYRSHKDSHSIEIHPNVKQMFIEFGYGISIFDDNFIDDYFKCVPDLNKLVIHRKEYEMKLDGYLTYQWLIVPVQRYFHLLEQFKFFLFYRENSTNQDNLCQLLKTNFSSLHNQQYKSKLVLATI